MISPSPIKELRQLLPSLPVPICVLDRDTRYLAASPSYAELCGIDFEDLPGKTMLDLCPQNLVANAHRDFCAFDCGGSVADHEIAFRGRTFLVSVKPIRGIDERSTIATFVVLNDISAIENKEMPQATVNVAPLPAVSKRIAERAADGADLRRPATFTKAGSRQYSQERRRSSAQETARDSFARPGSALGLRIPLASLIQTLAVAECLSFCRAATALGTSQSSVSARIKALEESLGTLLFERNTRGVRLTDAGRQFVEQVSAGIDQLEHAVKTAGMAASGECGRLRMGVHALIQSSFLAEMIGRYRKNHPGIEIEITESTARDAIMQLRADRLDIVFLAGAPRLPDCRTRRIWTEPLLAVLSDRHQLAGQPTVNWVDLADETFLVRHGGTGPQVYDHIMVRLADRWATPSILRFDVGRGALLTMVGEGFGITIVGAATSLLPTQGLVFLPIADEPESVPFSAVWSPTNRSQAVRNLLDLASETSRRYDSPSPAAQ